MHRILVNHAVALSIVAVDSHGNNVDITGQTHWKLSDEMVANLEIAEGGRTATLTAGADASTVEVMVLADVELNLEPSTLVGRVTIEIEDATSELPTVDEIVIRVQPPSAQAPVDLETADETDTSDVAGAAVAGIAGLEVAQATDGTFHIPSDSEIDNVEGNDADRGDNPTFAHVDELPFTPADNDTGTTGNDTSDTSTVDEKPAGAPETTATEGADDSASGSSTGDSGSDSADSGE